MIYLIDTDMLIFMIRGLKSGKRPAQRQRARLLVMLPGELGRRQRRIVSVDCIRIGVRSAKQR